MSEILKNRLRESVGKEIKVFLKNSFRYFGKLTDTDDTYFEILDYKTNAYKLIPFDEVHDLEVKA